MSRPKLGTECHIEIMREVCAFSVWNTPHRLVEVRFSNGLLDFVSFSDYNYSRLKVRSGVILIVVDAPVVGGKPSLTPHPHFMNLSNERRPSTAPSELEQYWVRYKNIRVFAPPRPSWVSWLKPANLLAFIK